jgi:ferredoxin, 2Fe-2S
MGMARVLPSETLITIENGETLLAAAQRQGYRWPNICGGQGTCRTCFVEVTDGLADCSTIGSLEREGIEALKRPLDGTTRLACQLQVQSGTVTVTKRGVRRAAQRAADT